MSNQTYVPHAITAHLVCKRCWFLTLNKQVLILSRSCGVSVCGAVDHTAVHIEKSRETVMQYSCSSLQSAHKQVCAETELLWIRQLPGRYGYGHSWEVCGLKNTNSPPAVLFPHRGNSVRSDRTEEDLHIETYIKADRREDDEHGIHLNLNVYGNSLYDTLQTE